MSTRSESATNESASAPDTRRPTEDKRHQKVPRVSFAQCGGSMSAQELDLEAPSAAEYYIALGKHLAFGAEWPYASFPSPATPRYLCQNTFSYYVKQEGLCSINYYDPSKYRHQ